MRLWNMNNTEDMNNKMQCKAAEHEDMTREYQSEYYQMNGTKLVRNPSVCICMYLCTCIIIRMLDTQKYNILWN